MSTAYAKPVLTVNPGRRRRVETEDAFGGVITSEQDSPTAKLRFPFLNPRCGPVASAARITASTRSTRMLLSQARPKYTMGASVLKNICLMTYRQHGGGVRQ